VIGVGIISSGRCVLGALIAGYGLAVILLYFLVGEVFGFGYVIVGAVAALIGAKVIDSGAPERERGVAGVLGLLFAIGIVWTNLQLWG
jgi:hypothetical protein